MYHQTLPVASSCSGNKLPATRIYLVQQDFVPIRTNATKGQRHKISFGILLDPVARFKEEEIANAVLYSTCVILI